jgi:hypothetical protein
MTTSPSSLNMGVSGKPFQVVPRLVFRVSDPQLSVRFVLSGSRIAAKGAGLVRVVLFVVARSRVVRRNYLDSRVWMSLRTLEAGPNSQNSKAANATAYAAMRSNAGSSGDHSGCRQNWIGPS